MTERRQFASFGLAVSLLLAVTLPSCDSFSLSKCSTNCHRQCYNHPIEYRHQDLRAIGTVARCCRPSSLLLYSTTEPVKDKDVKSQEASSTIQNDEMEELSLDKEEGSSIRKEENNAKEEKRQTLPGPTKDEYSRGMQTIATITLLFSSNSPVLHAAFVSASQPPPVLLLNAATSTVALTGIFTGGPLLDATVPLPCTITDNDDLSCNDTPPDLSRRAGLELGLWKMLGTTANLYGLSLTSADHGAFLIQLTTLIVPVVQGFMGVPIPKRIWSSIALALTGVFFFTQDFAGGNATSGSLTGDALCVLAAVFYATYDLRLFEWGKKVKPLDLIKNKIAVQAGLSVALLAAVGGSESFEYIQNISSSLSAGGDGGGLWVVGAAVLWSGIVINALVPFLQVGGQQAVGATRAQVVYASQPLWAALLSLCLLGETLGTEGLIGGSLFLSAMFLAASADEPIADCDEKNCEV